MTFYQIIAEGLFIAFIILVILGSLITIRAKILMQTVLGLAVAPRRKNIEETIPEREDLTDTVGKTLYFGGTTLMRNNTWGIQDASG